MSYEEIQINDADDAVRHLSHCVKAIASQYQENIRDDVEQSCWVQIISLVNQGCQSSYVLVKRAKHAAQREYKHQHCHGLRPLRSKHAPPERQYVNWVGNFGSAESNEQFSEPERIQNPGAFHELLEALVYVTEGNPQLWELVEETARMVTEGSASSRVTVADLSRRLGVTRWVIHTLLHHIRESYRGEFDVD